MAMIASTIMISSSVKPDCRRRARWGARLWMSSMSSRWDVMGFSWSSLSEILHVHDGLKNREDDEAHGRGHDDDEQGRQHRRELGDLAVDVALVGDGDVLQHRLELARTLAHGHHVHHHRRELPRALERRRDRLALAD